MSCVCVGNGAPVVAIAGLMRHVVPFCAGIPHDLGLDLVRQAYIEAARRSGLLTAECELPIQRDVATYPLDAPEGYEVHAIHPTHNNKHVHFSAVDYWITCGYRFRVLNNDEIEFYDVPASDATESVKLTVIVIPQSCVDTIPTAVATAFGRGIAMKAVADAMRMPKKEWTSYGAADSYERQYNRTVMEMRNLAITNRGSRSPSFQPVRII